MIQLIVIETILYNERVKSGGDIVRRSLSENQFLTKIMDSHVKVFQNNSNIREDAMRSNLSRLNYLAITTIVIHSVMLLQIWFTEVTPELTLWRSGLLVSHIILISYMVFIFIVTLQNRHNDEFSRWLDLLSIMTSIVVLGVGTSISILDQMVMTSITPLIIACITAGTVILMRPIYSFVVFGFTYFFYFYLLGWIVLDETILLSNRINGFSIIGVGLLLSIIFWRYYYKTTVQKKFIEKQRQQLELMAYNDSLTTLPNRRYFDELLKREITAIKENNHVSAILMLDIDDFKQINDNYGHPAGDKVLMEFSNLLSDTIRTNDIVARFGGEEFIILMPNISAKDSFIHAEKLRQAIQNHVIFVKNDTLTITASFGVVQLDKQNQKFDELYHSLDRALSVAKENGKNRVVLSNE